MIADTSSNQTGTGTWKSPTRRGLTGPPNDFSSAPVVRATASFSSPLDATLTGTGANAVRFDTGGAPLAVKGGGKLLIHGRLPTELNYIRLGSAEFITIPGELLPEIGFDIQARMTGYPRMIVGLANDELGYIVPGYDFNEKVYEESMSVGAAMGPMIRQAAYELAAMGRCTGSRAQCESQPQR